MPLMFGAWVQITAPQIIGARDLLAQHRQQWIYEVRGWPLAARAALLLRKLKAGSYLSQKKAVTLGTLTKSSPDLQANWFIALTVYGWEIGYIWYKGADLFFFAQQC